MATETTQTEAVNNGTTTQSAAVNAEQQTQGQAVNTKAAGDSQESAVSQPEMVNYNGYKIPKLVLEDIKKNSYFEGQKKKEKELAEQGLLKTKEDQEAIETHSQIMDQIGDIIGDGKKMGKKELDEFVQRSLKSAELAHKKKLEAYENQIKELSDANSKVLTDILSERRDSALRNASIKSGVNPDALDDFLLVLRSQNRLKFDDDMRTPIVLTPDGKEAMYDEQGNPKSVETYVAEELQKKPVFQKAAKAGGAGAQYNRDKDENQLLFRPRANPITYGPPQVHMKTGGHQ